MPSFGFSYEQMLTERLKMEAISQGGVPGEWCEGRRKGRERTKSGCYEASVCGQLSLTLLGVWCEQMSEQPLNAPVVG